MSTNCYRVRLLVVGAVCSLALALAPVRESHASDERPPNVLFILADDLGWRDLGIEGSAFYESPHIDSIARAGMRFTAGYATCQVCSPSRCSIMTGKYPARVGITDYIGAPEGRAWKRNTRLLPAHYRHELPASETTLAEAFRDAGYRTFFAGKWHLGGEGSLPTDHGFDVNFGGHHRGSPPGGFFAPYKNPLLKDGPDGESLPIRLGKETARFVDDHADQPFFAYLAFYSVHAPIQCTRPRWEKFREKAHQFKAPEHRFVIDRTSPVRQVQDHPVYAGMVEAMDDAVGIVLDALHRNGLSEKTMIVFTSDNGGVSAGDGKATSNLPLRGGKGRQWEGGIREPFYIVWPGVVSSGSTCAVPVTGADFYPTLLEMAGLPSRPEQHTDGVSLVPLLQGETIDDRDLFWHYPHYGNQGGEPSSIIRSGDWKLIHYYEDGRDELYHLHDDPSEQHNLASAQSDRTKQLRSRLAAWLAEVAAKNPTPNPNFDLAGHERDVVRTREEILPNLEAQAAAFLRDDYAPNGWWGSQPTAD